jgi:hypothetical protein
MLQVPTGLVVSSDQEARRQLAQVLRQCALVPVLAASVVDSGTALVRNEISVRASRLSSTPVRASRLEPRAFPL